MSDQRRQIKKTELSFVDKAEQKSLPKEPSANRVCTVCLRPIWHQKTRGVYARNCGPVCVLTRRFLGGMRSPEATWDIMRAKSLSTWDSMEAFWRDMGSTYFEGAFLIRISRSIPHGPNNSRWVPYHEAKKVQALMARKARDSRMLPSGVQIGEVAKKFGLYTFLFQRICGSISKRYNVPIDVVYEEFASVPPPTADWKNEITVFHQGRQYTLFQIALEARVTVLGLYYRWMKGMYVIDDDLAYKLQLQRSKYYGKKKNSVHTWQNGEFQ